MQHCGRGLRPTPAPASRRECRFNPAEFCGSEPLHSRPRASCDISNDKSVVAYTPLHSRPRASCDSETPTPGLEVFFPALVHARVATGGLAILPILLRTPTRACARVATGKPVTRCYQFRTPTRAHARVATAHVFPSFGGFSPPHARTRELPQLWIYHLIDPPSSPHARTRELPRQRKMSQMANLCPRTRARASCHAGKKVRRILRPLMSLPPAARGAPRLANGNRGFVLMSLPHARGAPTTIC